MVIPKMNGDELAGRLKMVRSNIRVAFMSGYSEFSRGEMGNQFPQTPILQKPFSPATLVGIVRQALTESTTDQSAETMESRVT
jgi:DNA-binding NtrC family response regulator